VPTKLERRRRAKASCTYVSPARYSAGNIHGIQKWAERHDGTDRGRAALPRSTFLRLPTGEGRAPYPRSGSASQIQRNPDLHIVRSFAESGAPSAKMTDLGHPHPDCARTRIPSGASAKCRKCPPPSNRCRCRFARRRFGPGRASREDRKQLRRPSRPLELPRCLDVSLSAGGSFLGGAQQTTEHTISTSNRHTHIQTARTRP
jgi:hypothetical protein